MPSTTSVHGRGSRSTSVSRNARTAAATSAAGGIVSAVRSICCALAIPAGTSPPPTPSTTSHSFDAARAKPRSKGTRRAVDHDAMSSGTGASQAEAGGDVVGGAERQNRQRRGRFGCDCLRPWRRSHRRRRRRPDRDVHLAAGSCSSYCLATPTTVCPACLDKPPQIVGRKASSGVLVAKDPYVHGPTQFKIEAASGRVFAPLATCEFWSRTMTGFTARG